jgi:hypothetical protein
LIGGIFSYFFPFFFSWQSFGFVALAAAFSLGFSLYEKKKIPVEKQNEFERECKMAMRGHLKASILFWVHFYRKEKVKTLEDAKMPKKKFFTI